MRGREKEAGGALKTLSGFGKSRSNAAIWQGKHAAALGHCGSEGVAKRIIMSKELT